MFRARPLRSFEKLKFLEDRRSDSTLKIQNYCSPHKTRKKIISYTFYLYKTQNHSPRVRKVLGHHRKRRGKGGKQDFFNPSLSLGGARIFTFQLHSVLILMFIGQDRGYKFLNYQSDGSISKMSSWKRVKFDLQQRNSGCATTTELATMETCGNKTSFKTSGQRALLGRDVISGNRRRVSIVRAVSFSGIRSKKVQKGPGAKLNCSNNHCTAQ